MESVKSLGILHSLLSCYYHNIMLSSHNLFKLSKVSSLPFPQFVPLNPGGQTQTPYLSSHIPPLRQIGQSLEQEGGPHLFAIQAMN